MIRIKDMNRSGLFPEHTGIATLDSRVVRATIPAVEALRKAGAEVAPNGPPEHTYTVALGDTLPPDLVAVRLPGGQVGLRLSNEPEYPIEYPDMWLQAEWAPCPKCGAPLIWYEAGFVPGYRVCARKPYHHVQVR